MKDKLTQRVIKIIETLEWWSVDKSKSYKEILATQITKELKQEYKEEVKKMIEEKRKEEVRGHYGYSILTDVLKKLENL